MPGLLSRAVLKNGRASSTVTESPKSQMGMERLKDDTSQHDAATNLYNSSPRIFLVSTKKPENLTLGRMGGKHDKHRARKT